MDNGFLANGPNRKSDMVNVYSNAVKVLPVLGHKVTRTESSQ